MLSHYKRGHENKATWNGKCGVLLSRTQKNHPVHAFRWCRQREETTPPTLFLLFVCVNRFILENRFVADDRSVATMMMAIEESALPRLFNPVDTVGSKKGRTGQERQINEGLGLMDELSSII